MRVKRKQAKLSQRYLVVFRVIVKLELPKNCPGDVFLELRKWKFGERQLFSIATHK